MRQKKDNSKRGVLEDITMDIRKRQDDELKSILDNIETRFGHITNVYFKEGSEASLFEVLLIDNSHVNGYPLIMSQGLYKHYPWENDHWLEIGLYVPPRLFEGGFDFSVEWLFNVGELVLNKLTNGIEPMTIYQMDDQNMVVSDQELYGCLFWDGGDTLKEPSPISLPNGRSIMFLYAVPIFKNETDYLNCLNREGLKQLLESHKGIDVFNFNRALFHENESLF